MKMDIIERYPIKTDIIRFYYKNSYHLKSITEN